MLLNVIFFLSPYQSGTINIDGSISKSSNSLKRLEAIIHSSFTLKRRINSHCQKSSQKRYALSSISQYLSPNKKYILFKTFVTSQLNYCPLVWMCHSRTLSNRINKINHSKVKMVSLQ